MAERGAGAVPQAHSSDTDPAQSCSLLQEELPWLYRHNQELLGATWDGSRTGSASRGFQVFTVLGQELSRVKDEQEDSPCRDRAVWSQLCAHPALHRSSSASPGLLPCPVSPALGTAGDPGAVLILLQGW